MRATQHFKEIGDFDYYNSYTLTNLYVQLTFGERLSTINLTNDSSTDTVQFSWDGATLAGEVRPGESVKVNTNQKTSIYIKGTDGGDTCRVWSYADVRATAVTTSFSPLGVVNKSYEGTVTAGNSPIVLDFNGDAGRNAVDGWVNCDGDGDMLVAFSRDGITYGDDWTMKKGENTGVRNFDIDSIRITHSGTDAAYRVVLI
jgi:hypothetical protein